MWIRDYSEGSTSGKGSFCATSYDEIVAWVLLNPKIENFMLSDYLVGRNLACFLLYNQGELLKFGVAERIEYIMGKVSISGITGNTSFGKLLNDNRVVDVSTRAVKALLDVSKELMHGLVVVDLKEDMNGIPRVTEINLRHVAFTSTFASAGFNFSEFQLAIMTDRIGLLSQEKEKIFPETNAMLRDVDGLPIYIEKYKEIKTGEAFVI